MHGGNSFLDAKEYYYPENIITTQLIRQHLDNFNTTVSTSSLQNTRPGSSLSFVVMAHSERNKQDSGGGAERIKDLPTVSNDPPRDIYITYSTNILCITAAYAGWGILVIASIAVGR